MTKNASNKSYLIVFTRNAKIVWRKIVRWLLFLLLGAVLGVGIVYAYLASQTGERAIEREVFKAGNSRPLVFAHRGGGGLIPENTLEAFVYSALFRFAAKA